MNLLSKGSFVALTFAGAVLLAPSAIAQSYPQPVPEPGTLALLGIGALVGLAISRRKRK